MGSLDAPVTYFYPGDMKYGNPLPGCWEAYCEDIALAIGKPLLEHINIVF